MTPEDYATIADKAYKIDPKWQNPPSVKGESFFSPDGKHEYLVDDTFTDPASGFQGISAVQVVNGQPDYSEVVVAFAGTNPVDLGDLGTDGGTVVGGQNGDQLFSAEIFASTVNLEVKSEHPGAVVTTTGHSLGGYLAQWIAAQNRWSSMTFNAPDLWDRLSPEEQKWVREQVAAGNFVNYVNEWDPIGNSRGNGSGAAVFVKDYPGRAALDYHNLWDAFGFDPDGAVVGAGAQGHSLAEIMGNALTLTDPELNLAVKVTELMSAVNAAGMSAAVSVGTAGLAGLRVMVDTVAAVSLAASIAGTTGPLQTIKSENHGLVERMQTGLDGAKQLVYVYPFVTEADIDRCVDVHRLHVHQNIDLDAVAAVDRLVDDHIAVVNNLSDGILRAVTNTVAQDVQWAAATNGR
ncbi:DUF6792 domain-containing protein [Leifsonia sp. CL147]|uniref:DUF6792 domain-containing protein n=1 Tax=Leifsonia sp. CL147 TaxID=1798215 RepID=UPI0008F3C326|nr:DUF6792 domain-containing protein [Leifsonia sp. CL147]SFL81906.1 hypothetical protein SAMN04515692_113109 [Leifsonia sp. CL147]